MTRNFLTGFGFRPGLVRLLVAGCFAAALITALQVPGCAPEPRRAVFGGLAETVMTDGELVPVTLRFLDRGEPTPVRAYFR